MSVNKYPTAEKYLKQIRALRAKLETLTQWIDPLSGREEGKESSGHTVRASAENHSETNREILSIKRQLDEMIATIRRAVRRLSSPGEALLIELIFIFGFDAGTICASLSLSRSGFYSRLSKSMTSLEAHLKRLAPNGSHAASPWDDPSGGAPDFTFEGLADESVPQL